MKIDNRITSDIQLFIEQVYVKKDNSSIKKVNWNEYVEFEDVFKSMFPESCIENNTDFNENFGYDFNFYLSSDNDFINDYENAIKKHKSVDMVGVNISKVIPYFTLSYWIYTFDNPQVSASGIPITDQQFNFGSKLKKYLRSKGYKELSLENSWIYIPDIESDTKDAGEIMVRDCIY